MPLNVCAATGSDLAAPQTKGRERSAAPPTAGTQSAAETEGRTNEGVRRGREGERGGVSRGGECKHSQWV